MIELNKRAIDGSEVGSIFISGEMKSHVEDESVYLSVQFNSKVRHFCNKIILLLERSWVKTSKLRIRIISINCHINHDRIVLRFSLTHLDGLCCPKIIFFFWELSTRLLFSFFIKLIHLLRFFIRSHLFLSFCVCFWRGILFFGNCVCMFLLIDEISQFWDSFFLSHSWHYLWNQSSFDSSCSLKKDCHTSRYRTISWETKYQDNYISFLEMLLVICFLNILKIRRTLISWEIYSFECKSIALDHRWFLFDILGFFIQNGSRSYLS